MIHFRLFPSPKTAYNHLGQSIYTRASHSFEIKYQTLKFQVHEIHMLVSDRNYGPCFVLFNHFSYVQNLLTCMHIK